MFGDDAADRSTRSQPGELLRTVHLEGRRFDLEPEIQERLGSSWFVGGDHGLDGQDGVLVGILGILDLFVQIEVEPVEPFVTDRQVGEDEIAGLGRAIQVCNACYGHASQDRADGCSCIADMCHRARVFQRSKQKEVGIVGESDVGFVQLIVEFGFVDTQFDDGRRVDRTTVSGCCIC